MLPVANNTPDEGNPFITTSPNVFEQMIKVYCIAVYYSHKMYIPITNL